ncbi:MAG: aminopeptidase P family protein [Bdellovibrionales bacterium]
MTQVKSSYQDRLTALRAAMRDVGVNGYIIPRADEFQGEFVASYAERLKWLTGFTGSGGAALVLEDTAFALTDGRYTLQIREQTDPALFETGDYIKKPLAQWVAAHAPENAVIGYDPWLHTPSQIEKISGHVAAKNIILKAIEKNLIDRVWKNRPKKPKGQVTGFPVDVAGKTCGEKRMMIAEKIRNKGGDAAIITMPDSISWLLNVRGADVDCIPYVLSYALVDRGGYVSWFVDPRKVPLDFHLYEGVRIIPLPEMKKYLERFALEAERPILIDSTRTPIWFNNCLKRGGAIVKNFDDPCVAIKARKTQAEQNAIKTAHIADGVALVKFLKWLEGAAPKGKLTEISVTKKLHAFRALHPAFKGNSFPTIAGFGANGAIIHYRADEKTNASIAGNGLLLIDSGGQYAGEHYGTPCYGTTDITRTVAIGAPTQDMRESFTRVLKGHIALAAAQFPLGTLGAQIDTLARKPLWDAGLDYAHGTGHGVGCYLGVHEDAANISSRGQKPLQPGMLLSNEPGYYKENEYGIRIENLVFVRKSGEASLCFETISFAPIDTNLIIAEMLSDKKRAWMNAYHAAVFENLSPHLNLQDKNWLQSKTRAI